MRTFALVQAPLESEKKKSKNSNQTHGTLGKARAVPPESRSCGCEIESVSLVGFPRHTEIALYHCILELREWHGMS